nr:type II toxin-antitoxin system death-on-curing family toxin [uncultured Trichococcus sp.]
MNYLTEEDLIQINTRIIKRYTPKEMIGIREPAALNAVVEAPKATAFGVEAYPTIFDKATILILGVAGKQLFQNANKRTAVAATDIFFLINGYTTTWEHDEYIEFVTNVVKLNEETSTNFDELKNYTSAKLREKYKTKD